MKPHLMKDWYVVQNGGQIDIHVRDKEHDRELTVVADMRDEQCAKLIANSPKYKAALEKILSLCSLADGEEGTTKEAKIRDVAYEALGHVKSQPETINPDAMRAMR